MHSKDQKRGQGDSNKDACGFKSENLIVLHFVCFVKNKFTTGTRGTSEKKPEKSGFLFIG